MVQVVGAAAVAALVLLSALGEAVGVEGEEVDLPQIYKRGTQQLCGCHVEINMH